MRDPRERTYLDHNASAPLCEAARAAMLDAMLLVGNPSSTHAEGRKARAALEQARGRVASLLGADAASVVFTSGASEAASTCLVPEWGLSDGSVRRFERLAVLATDHACLLAGGRFEADRIDRLPTTSDGIVRLDALDAWLSRHGPAGLLAISGANNETGVVQPLPEVAQRVRTAGAALVVDAVQMPGRVPLDDVVDASAAVILSAHKIGGPKGVGAIVLGDTGFRPRALVTGGAQETRQRAGTEALWAIAGFGAAAQEAGESLAEAEGWRSMRMELEAELRTHCPRLLIIGEQAERLPQTLALQVPGLRAETAQIRLDLEGFAVSAGSACGSGKVAGSHVLAALTQAGLAADADGGLLRVSFGRGTSRSDLRRFAAAFERMVQPPQLERAA